MARGHPNLIGWWKGNGSLLDSSGNGLDGEWRDPSVAAYERGKFGNAMSFSGVTGKGVDLGIGTVSAKLEGKNGATFSAWVKPMDITAANASFLGTYSQSEYAAFICRFISGGAMRILFRSNRTENTQTITTPTTPLIENTWTFLTYSVSLTEKEARFYSDGKLIYDEALETERPAFVIGLQTVPFTLGQIENGNQVFNGLMNDVRLHDCALSQGDIKRVMHGFQPLGRYVSPPVVLAQRGLRRYDVERERL